jgi:hypothetical protein
LWGESHSSAVDKYEASVAVVLVWNTK